MKLGYKYYRNNLITLAILSVACLGIFWDHLRGKGNPKDEPSALILIAVLMLAGNVGLFIAMRRAKKREDSERLHQSTVSSPEAGRPLLPQPAPLSVVQRRRVVAVCALLALSVAAFAWNWHTVHYSGYYDKKIAFVAPLALVFAVLFVMFRDDPTVLQKPIPLRVWAAWALSAALGFCNCYALSHRLY
ncbi:MAG: hypothetical protein ABSD29_14460 [Verrucomicrobiota bacterium]|jgi:hypothetical protein